MRYAALILLAAWLVPLLVSVNFWRQEVAAALSGAFHRPVHVGDVHLQMVGGLGFQVSDVVVEEDPAFGAEPFARIETADARIALLPLLRGHVEFSKLSLVSPSFNVVRNAGGAWNLSALRETISGGEPAHRAAPPAAGERHSAPVGASPQITSPQIHVEGGRVNFKMTSRKKAYRIDAFSLDLAPPSSPEQPWKFQAEGMPSRSDRPFRPTSVLQARGELGPLLSGMPTDAGIPLHLDWHTDDAMLAELLTVLAGRDMSVHGQYSFEGHLAGTTSLFRVSAKGRVEDLHRWDLMPAPKSPALHAALAGIVDLSTETVELNSLNIPLGSGEVIVRGRVEGLFGHPRLQMEMELQQAPLAAVAALLPQFTTRVPQGFRAEGAVQGSIRFEGLGSAYGKFDVSSGYLQASAPTTDGASMLRFNSFPIAVDGAEIRIGPVVVRPTQGGAIQAAAQWDGTQREASWRLQGERISIPAVARIAADFGWASSQIAISTGNLSLQANGTAGAERPAEITGGARLSNVTLTSSRTATPLKIAAAQVRFEKRRVTVQPLAAGFGSIDLQGSVAVRLPASPAQASQAATAAVEFTLDASLVDIREVAQLLTPPTPQNSFFGLGRGSELAASPLDEKIAALLGAVEARGTVHAEELRYQHAALENVRAEILLRNHAIEIPEFSADQAEGTQRGSGNVHFAPGAVSLSLESRFANLNVARLLEPSERWSGAVEGLITGTAQVSAAGDTWQNVVSHWTGSGHAAGNRIMLRDSLWTAALDETELPTGPLSFTAAFEIDPRAIHIDEMKMVSRSEPAGSGVGVSARSVASATPNWSITGDVGFDRHLNLAVEPEGERAELRLAGTLESPQFSRRPPSATTAAVNSGRGASVPPK
jgi:AsmA-like protein